MHYSGTLKTGKKFDSSYDRGTPFKFEVSRQGRCGSEGEAPERVRVQIGRGMVIRGWDEGVIAMSLGEKARLEITPDFGYGARGAGGVIPPNADLTFEVELLKIN